MIVSAADYRMQRKHKMDRRMENKMWKYERHVMLPTVLSFPGTILHDQ